MSRMSRTEMLRWDMAWYMHVFLVWLNLPYKVVNGRVDYGWYTWPERWYVKVMDKICPGGMPDSW